MSFSNFSPELSGEPCPFCKNLTPKLSSLNITPDLDLGGTCHWLTCRHVDVPRPRQVALLRCGRAAAESAQLPAGCVAQGQGHWCRRGG